MPYQNKQKSQVKGEYTRIPLKDAKQLICEKHEYKIDVDSREINCLKCGLGRRINLTEIVEIDGKLFLKDGSLLTTT